VDPLRAFHMMLETLSSSGTPTFTIVLEASWHLLPYEAARVVVEAKICCWRPLLSSSSLFSLLTSKFTLPFKILDMSSHLLIFQLWSFFFFSWPFSQISICFQCHHIVHNYDLLFFQICTSFFSFWFFFRLFSEFGFFFHFHPIIQNFKLSSHLFLISFS